MPDLNPVTEALNSYATQVESELASKDAQLAEAGINAQRLADVTEQLSAANAQLTAIQENMNDTPNDIRTAELEGQLASLTAERDSAQRNLDSANNRIRRRDATISDLQAALAKK